MSSSEYEPLPGVAALADRPVDGRRAALVMSGAGVALSVASVLAVAHLLGSANQEGPGAAALRSIGAPPTAPGPARRLAVVLVDGLRLDEARELPSLRALGDSSATGEIRLPTPTLSRPFYHVLFTGVPPHTAGVRTNGFRGRARHDAVPTRVRDAGGRVAWVAEGLDWMRRMHGTPADGGTDDPGPVSAERLGRALHELDAAPALLVVHLTSTDGTAHHEGIHSSAHRAALAEADRVIAHLAADPDLPLVILSDHGHLPRGGHGGPEPEVARAPLVVRAPGIAPGPLDTPVDATELAALLATLLGLPSPAHSVAGPPAALTPEPADVGHRARLADLARHGERLARGWLRSRQVYTMPAAALLALMALGTIKRAYGLDRGVGVAILAWPAAVVGAHLALGRPLSLSAIDTVVGHSARVAGLGGGGALVAIVLALGLAKSPHRARRVAASTGWSAAACALLSVAWVGVALGPWPLSPAETYLPLLALGAAAPALLVASLVLVASGLKEPRGPEPAPPGRGPLLDEARRQERT